MRLPRLSRLSWVVLAAVAVLVAAAVIWRDDIRRTFLDPKQPFQTYRPPPAPDYASARAWALLPPTPAEPVAFDSPPVDVFFVHPTTFDGGRDWNGPLDDPKAAKLLAEVMLPNYAGPFARVGRLFAPRYRQASLYAELTRRDDAREARRFAYGDVRAAFDVYLTRYSQGRAFILAGVEQGGVLVDRLLDARIGPDKGLRARLVAAYLPETVVPADEHGPTSPVPACRAPTQTGCVLAWARTFEGALLHGQDQLDHALVWGPDGELTALGDRAPLCVNPLTGVEGGPPAAARLNRGATNASGLEWGARPAFLPREVSTRCERGLLVVSRPASASFRPGGGWTDQWKVPGYNLFYADEEADAQARVAAWLAKGRAAQSPALRKGE